MAHLTRRRLLGRLLALSASACLLGTDQSQAQSSRELNALKDALPFQRFRVAATGMLPLLAPGDIAVFNQTDDAKASITRGDVIALRTSIGAALIKRVIGLPGEEIEMVAGVPIINGVPLQQSFIGPFDGEVPGPAGEGALRLLEEHGFDGRSWRLLDAEAQQSFDDVAPMRAPEEAFFVLGDFRDNSFDSRFAQFGLVRRDQILGTLMREH